MLLHIRHETRYDYEEPVSYSIQALKLTPRADPGQRIVNWRVLSPGDRLEQVDPFGNLTHIVTLETPHREMRIVVEGVAEMDDDSTLMPQEAGGLSPLAYLAPTPLTRPIPPCARSRSGISGVTPRAARLMDLVVGIREAVAYQPGITDVTHSAAEALDLGLGVCQDQAHVLVACCRAAGVPARYVSGYFHGRGPRRGREPRVGRRVARPRPGLAQPRRDARRAGRDAPLPAGRRSRLPRRRPGARRAARRRTSRWR